MRIALIAMLTLGLVGLGLLDLTHGHVSTGLASLAFAAGNALLLA